MASVNLEFPEFAQPLFEPHRYKVLHGGRGSAKSWTVARALILRAAQGGERILCTREIQKSIKDSVHRLLSDQIEAMGLGGKFEILDTEIRGPGGSVFLFAGLQNHTVQSIKSYEGVTRCWVEEAQVVTKKSWDILIPTIRAEGSEIWVTFNPELDTDEAWKRFVEVPPPDGVVIQANWRDNPWFSEVLEQERKHAEATQPKEDYEQIWEGRCRPAVVGAIYASEMAQMVREGRILNVPYDPKLKAHAVWDLGWNDSMSIAVVQRGVSDLRVIDYIEDNFKTLDYYAAKLKAMPFNWGHDWLPHDGFHGDFKTGKSAAEILKSFGRKPKQTPNMPVEVGIKAARMTFPRMYMDRQKCERLIECAKRYRRSLPNTGEPGSPVHDQYSHGADVLRYLSIVADLLKNEDEAPQILTDAAFIPADAYMGY